MFNKKTAESLAIQLECICKHNPDLSQNVGNVKHDMLEALDMKSKISSPELRRLNQVLFATRAFDLGLKTFLLAADVEIDNRSRHIRGYLSYLKNYNGVFFDRMKGDIADRIETTIVYDRNRLVHVAGQYPTPRDVDTILQNVGDYLSVVISLKK